MLTEDQVIDAVASYLVERRWTLISRCTAVQRGEDLVMSRDGERLVIEAKGAGSSREGSARYGKPFDSGQVFDHVAKAVLKGLAVAAGGEAHAGVALPDNLHHRRFVNPVLPALASVGVAVFWVTEDERVIVEGPWGA